MSSASPNTNAKLPVTREKEIEIERMQIEALNKVLSDPELKTQVTQGERILLTELEELFTDAFPISRDIAAKKYPNAKQEMFGFLFGLKVVAGYMKKGKALNRLGISEDVAVFKAYCDAKTEEAKASARAKRWEK